MTCISKAKDIEGHLMNTVEDNVVDGDKFFEQVVTEPFL